MLNALRRRWLWVLLALPVAAIAATLLALWFFAGRSTQGELQVYWEMPAFSFVDQTGATFTSEDMGGQVVVANFVFLNCTEFCPTVLTPRMRELQDRLRSEGLLGAKVGLLSFSVDPKNDTPAKLRAYAESFGAQYPSWRFLTGSEQEMRRVVSEGLKLAFERTAQQIDHVHPDGSAHKHEYNVAHTNRFILVDSKGRVRAFPDGVSDWDLEKLVADIRRLLE